MTTLNDLYTEPSTAVLRCGSLGISMNAHERGLEEFAVKKEKQTLRCNGADFERRAELRRISSGTVVFIRSMCGRHVV